MQSTDECAGGGGLRMPMWHSRHGRPSAVTRRCDVRRGPPVKIRFLTKFLPVCSEEEQPPGQVIPIRTTGLASSHTTVRRSIPGPVRDGAKDLRTHVHGVFNNNSKEIDHTSPTTSSRVCQAYFPVNHARCSAQGAFPVFRPPPPPTWTCRARAQGTGLLIFIWSL